jgi:hypothetical protein
VQPFALDDQLEVGEVGVLVVVDEGQVDGALREVVFGLEPLDGRATITERADDDRQPITDAGVVPNATCDRGVCGVELDRDKPRFGTHRSRDPKRAVAAIRSELQHKLRICAPDGGVEDFALLVADVDHEALLVTELVDRLNDVIQVTLTGIREHVLRERLLAAVADLPVLQELRHSKRHPQERPPKERQAPAADLSQSLHRQSAHRASSLSPLGLVLPLRAQPIPWLRRVELRRSVAARSRHGCEPRGQLPDLREARRGPPGHNPVRSISKMRC